MVMLFRTTDSAEFVHVNDTEADPAAARKAGDRWFLADGQPAGCTRFRVRPLSDEEMHRIAELEPLEQSREAARLGLLKIDGEDPGTVRDAMAIEIGELIGHVSAFPLVGRPSLSMAEDSPG